jgi:hypothetical protein
MKIKTIELNGKELPKKFVLSASSEELNFIHEHSAQGLLNDESFQIEGARGGLKLGISAASAAKLASFTGQLTSATTPQRSETSSEIYECLASIFNSFYEEGYEAAL